MKNIETLPLDDAAVLERLAIQAEEPRESFIDFAPEFLSVDDPPLAYIIPEYTPAGCLKCVHGDPRTMKSLAALEEFIAAGTETPAFGMERFRPTRKYRALYCSQEDHAPIVRPRVKKFLRTHGVDTFPDNLGFAVYKGIDFDSDAWQARFFDEIVDCGFEFVVIDPIRGFTAFADAGPKDVIPIAKFFRRLTARGITIEIVHHDVKPPTNGQDNRKRRHRASGGAWFSVSECPVAFEKIGDRQSLVSPEDYKFSGDPRPFTITYHEDDDGIRLIGEDSTAEEAQSLAVDKKVLTYLSEHPAATGNSIVKGIRARKEAVLDSLERLFRADKVDCVQKGRAKLWTLRNGKN